MIDRIQKVNLDEITALFLTVYQQPPWNDEWPDFYTAKTYLQEFYDNPSFIGYMVSENNRLIGACFGHTKTWWEGKEYFIDEFFITPDVQGQGWGSRFMKYIKTDLLSSDITTITLLTEKGFPAEKFYVKNGFTGRANTVFMVADCEGAE